MSQSREDIVPGMYWLNGSRDIAFEWPMGRYIGEPIEVLKKCKSGLYYIKTEDGKLWTVSKGNIDTAEAHQAREDRRNGKAPKLTLDSGWTVEATVDLPGQYGLDFAAVTAADLMDDILKDIFPR